MTPVAVAKMFCLAGMAVDAASGPHVSTAAPTVAMAGSRFRLKKPRASRSSQFGAAM